MPFEQKKKSEVPSQIIFIQFMHFNKGCVMPSVALLCTKFEIALFFILFWLGCLIFHSILLGVVANCIVLKGLVLQIHLRSLFLFPLNLNSLFLSH